MCVNRNTVKIGDKIYYVPELEPTVLEFTVTDMQDAKDDNQDLRMFVNGSNRYFCYNDPNCFLHKATAEAKLKELLKK